MKQRSRSMHGGDDLNGFTMLGNKHEEDQYYGEVQLHRNKPQEHFIEAQVQEGDTLQAIALRFYCSISELKRVNQIHKENEIYARRTIKVPVSPYSVLTELIPAQQQLQPPLSTSRDNSGITVHNLQNTVKKISMHQENYLPDERSDNNDCAIDCNSVILNSTLAPSVIPYTDSEVTEPVSEDTKLLPERAKVPVEAVVVKELTSHGADLGLKWFHLMCVVLILGVVIPLVYIMFYLDKTEHSNYSNHTSVITDNTKF